MIWLLIISIVAFLLWLDDAHATLVRAILSTKRPDPFIDRTGSLRVAFLFVSYTCIIFYLLFKYT